MDVTGLLSGSFYFAFECKISEDVQTSTGVIKTKIINYNN